jgi:hypothetical protein
MSGLWSCRGMLTTLFLFSVWGAGCLPLDRSCEGPVTIGDGTHTIVLSPDASPSERHAAEELQATFKTVTGWDLPVVSDGSPVDGSKIVLGLGPAAAELGVDPDPVELGEQGYALKTVPPHVVIAGTPMAGTLYGVYRFLEDSLGVRWFAPGVTRTPALTSVTVEASDRIVKPAFLWRHTSYSWPGKDDAFVSHAGDNSGNKGPDDPYGVQHAHDGRCHSYYTYVSPNEFFDTHPEYFSEIGGVRVREETQLCLTNPDVLDIVTERMLKRMADQPGVRQHNFSQMDFYNYCQCPRCTAMNERYGTQGGTQFWFVNQLAARTAAVFPDKLIGTLAYMYTEEPPVGMQMHPNVAVWLCHMYPSCDSHPIVSCPLNADFKRRAQAWSQIARHLYLWHYITDFTHYYNPFPNLRAMASDLKFYRDIGVEGVYLQGMGNAGGGGEFSLLRPYYGMKLLWDPDQDPEAVREEFLKGYYGEAWEPIRDYIEMLHDKVELDDVHMHLYTNPAQGYLTDAVMSQAEQLFDRAEARVSGDPELLERVRVARMPLTYARLFPRNGYEIRRGKVNWQSDIASLPEMVKFFQRMEDHGFQVVREAAGEPLYLAVIYLLIKMEPPVPHICNGVLRVDYAPLLGGRVLRITDRKTGTCVTAHNVKENLFFPFAGGLEDRVGEGFLFYGWVEPALGVMKTWNAVTLVSRTVDGFQLKKTLSLEPLRPILNVESVLTNLGDTPRTARLRSHLELDLGEVASTRVRFTSLAGERVDRDMTGVIAGMREGEHFYDQSAPAGSWTFSGTKGLQVTQRFDNEDIDSAWVYAFPETLGEVELELWAKRRELGPGESLTLRHQIEVRPAAVFSQDGPGA